MDQARAILLFENENQRCVGASAARITTGEGTAQEIFSRAGNPEKDGKLIKKVLSSGHKSILEHQFFSIAFNDVSVLAEQFMIEHRLASYTVKSRRYVNYSGAGYLVPAGLPEHELSAYRAGMDRLFALYDRLCEAGVPREDARFILPYSFRSNFYMTLNGRDLVRLIGEMCRGRGACLPELKRLGEQLKEQVEKLYPGVIAAETAHMPPCALPKRNITPAAGGPVKGEGRLLALSEDCREALSQAMAFSGRFPPVNGTYLTRENLRALTGDQRPRELEFVHARFLIKDVSLASVTHFTRHRMQSLLAPEVSRALEQGNYVLPETIQADPALRALYEDAFRQEAALARELLAAGLPVEEEGYLALAGQVIDLMLEMNGRELLHFLKLRTCSRAQWEIRALAEEMLAHLQKACPEIFRDFGPSCLVEGRCPEGRLSCGKPRTRQ